jgi:predicted anti-sigma-YlaC factor YlaD
MRCEECRQALSARLDGEDSPGERVPADQHVAACTACRRWLDDAAAVTRLARTGPVSPVIDVTKTVLASVPRRRRLEPAVRALLGLLGAAQVLLGAAQVAGVTGTHHSLANAAAEPAGHLWHESAAWNVAVGAGFAWIALRRTRPVGIVPTLTAFVAVLTLLTVNDLVAGQVDLGRVLSHTAVLVGYLVILYLSRPGHAPADPPAEGRTGTPRWRLRFDDEPPAPQAPRLRLIPGLGGQAHASVRASSRAA